MERAAANTRTPTIHEPAGYEFSPDVAEALPPQAQVELALQLSKVVLDTSRPRKAQRVIEPPRDVDFSRVRNSLTRLADIGRIQSRQGFTFGFATREALARDPQAMLTRNRVMSLTGFQEIDEPDRALLPECSRCGAQVSDPTMLTMVHGGLVCPVCRQFDERECPECHTHIMWEDMRAAPGVAPMCPRCFEARMEICPTCDRAVRRGEVRNGTCPGCVRDRCIQSYSHKPRPTFFTTRGRVPVLNMDEWCMGVEIETELPRGIKESERAYEVLQTAPDLFYAKHDGSLEHGVEYVSHPFSSDWMRSDAGSGMLKTVLAKMRETGHKSYDAPTCGMHVHVTKRPFLHGTLEVLLRFVQMNPSLILSLSRREESKLIQWANPRGTPTQHFADLDSGMREMSPTKYTAVNVTNKTIEFRIFRGTIAEAGFFANLEAVESMMFYCKNCATRGLLPSGPDYNAFVSENAARYPNLLATIINRAAKRELAGV